jgi:lysophospholipase L1-like esterase
MIINQILISFILVLGLWKPERNLRQEGEQIEETESKIEFYDAKEFAIIGRFHEGDGYCRLPEEYKEQVRSDLWELSKNTAGVAIRFRTNASTIIARWKVLNNTVMGHMAPTGIKGVDLYAKVNGSWQFVNVGIPQGQENQFTLLLNGKEEYREYMLYLPLYDGIEALSLGVNREASISKPKETSLISRRPVVYYGTSIAQGACASRPGLAYTNMLSRKLNRAFINLGFSGNGEIEMPLGRVMASIDAALYVIDCNHNTDAEIIYPRTLALVRFLKERKPDTPILLVEGFPYEHGYFNNQVFPEIEQKRKALYKAYLSLIESGFQEIYYRKAAGEIGLDHEGTVDGIHPNDIGMARLAESMFPQLHSILLGEEASEKENQ